MRSLLAGLVVLALVGPASADGTDPVRVRASASVAPCVRAALARQGQPVEVSVGGLRVDARTADVLAGSAGEVDRGLESDRALADTDVEIAKVPWVLAVSAGTADLDRVAASGATVAVLDGPEGHEARRFLARLPRERVRASRDPSVLRSAAARLVPLPLAGDGPRAEVKDILPLLAKAAVTRGARNEAAARLVVEFLGSGDGRAAFAACLPPS